MKVTVPILYRLNAFIRLLICVMYTADLLQLITS